MGKNRKKPSQILREQAEAGLKSKPESVRLREQAEQLLKQAQAAEAAEKLAALEKAQAEKDQAAKDLREAKNRHERWQRKHGDAAKAVDQAGDDGAFN